MRVASAIASIGSAVVVAACGGDGAPPPSSSAEQLPRFDLVEELRIDGYEANLTPIDTTHRVAVTPEGVIVIGQTQDFHVRFYSPEGELLSTVGQRGEGPGEFTGLFRIGWMGQDTLFAFDQSQQRFTLISPDFEYIRYVHVPAGAHPDPDGPLDLPEFGAVYGGVLYGDGTVYVRLLAPLSADLGDFDPEKILFARITEDGTILSYHQIQREYAAPFSIGPFLRLSDDGRRFAFLNVMVEGPDAGTFEVLMEDVESGDTIYTRRYPFEAGPVPMEIVDSINAQRQAMVDNYQAPSGLPPGVTIIAPEFEPFPYPPMLPPVIAMIAGQDESLWIRMRDTEDGRPYRVHDVNGEPLGTVVVPLNQRIAVASLEHVWVLERDEYDVESVLRYRVVPGEPVL